MRESTSTIFTNIICDVSTIEPYLHHVPYVLKISEVHFQKKYCELPGFVACTFSKFDSMPEIF